MNIAWTRVGPPPGPVRLVGGLTLERRSWSFGELHPVVHMVHASGSWYNVGSGLRTWRYDDLAWKEIVDEKQGKELGQSGRLKPVVVDGRLHVVTLEGRVFALDGERWCQVAQGSSAFKDRFVEVLAADNGRRIVVWGGETRTGRKLNDTLIFEGKRWRAAKKPSPQPADFKHGKKDEVYVDTAALWDAALRVFIRFGYEDVAVLGPDEAWTAYKPKGYTENTGSRRWEHCPIHDPETGETLVVDLAGVPSYAQKQHPAQVLRFDLKACTPLAAIEYPSELQPKKQHDAPAYSALKETFSFDATTRSLWGQLKDDSNGTYRLDLAELFEKAKSMGARTQPKSPSATKNTMR